MVQSGKAAAMAPTRGSNSLAADRGLTQTMRLAIRSRRAVEDHLGLGNLVRVALMPTKVCGAEDGSSDGPKFREHSTEFKSRSPLVDNVEDWRKGSL